jgi:hypothetical protein
MSYVGHEIQFSKCASMITLVVEHQVQQRIILFLNMLKLSKNISFKGKKNSKGK